MTGIINLNKPSGMTSNDAVVKIRGMLRRVTGEKLKVGHYGTLDPMATGVLPIAVGKATKLFDLMSAKVKKYEAVFVFGKTTDTLDAEGTFTVEGEKIPSKAEIEQVLPQFVGEIDQIPPAYSAKSVNGQRAYDLARKGKIVELAPKKISVYDLKLLGEIGEGAYKFEITCGGGTYIRAIARDIAAALDTVAYMSALTRTKSGAFELADAVSIEQLQENVTEYILPVECTLGDFPRYELPESLADAILNGVKTEIESLPKGDYVVSRAGRIIGIGENADYFRVKIRL